MSDELIKLMNTLDPTKVKIPTPKIDIFTTQRNPKCPECKSRKTIKINAELICKNCGLVLEGPNEYVDDTKITYPNGLNLFIND